MESGLVSAVQPGDRRDPICIYWFAIRRAGLSIPMAGGEVVPIRGCSIKENRCGWLFHLSSMRMSIHPDPRLLFHLLRAQASSLMMAQQASTKLLTNAGRILLTAAHRVALCVHRGRVPPRLPVPRSGYSHKVHRAGFTQSMFASLLYGPRQKARSTRFVIWARTIKW